MRLRVFRSLWGTTAPQTKAFDSLFGRLRSAGYAGIECSIADTATQTSAERIAFRRLMRTHNLQLIAGVYSGWVDYEGACDTARKSIPSHVATLREQLQTALELEPTHFNAHTGSDAFSDAQNLELFGSVQAMTDTVLGVRSAIGISHETHRGRSFFSPYSTARVLCAYPAVSLTADFSHWCVVSERLLDSTVDGEPDLMKWLCGRVAHVHARVGAPQTAQIPYRFAAPNSQRSASGASPAAPAPHPAYSSEIATHQRWWRWIWAAQRARGAVATTLTPEYGPPPYSLVTRNAADGATQTVPHNLDELIDTAKQSCEHEFSRLKSE